MTTGTVRVPSGTLPLRPSRRTEVPRAVDSFVGAAGSRGTTTTTTLSTTGARRERTTATAGTPSRPPAVTEVPLERRAKRAPVRGGLLIVLVAAAFTVGAPLLRPAAPPVAPTVEDSVARRAVLTTSNVRARPESSAAVTAVLPAGRTPEVLGRLADGSWLLVQTGPASSDQGWLPADRLPLSSGQFEALEVTQPAEAPTSAGQAPPVGLPDLVVSSVFLMRDGHIALEIRNDGDGPLTEAKIPVLVTRASGETVGVLEVGPTTLPPRGTATVVTPVIVFNTGTYTLQLDRQESINEARRDNNGATKLLVAGGG